MSKEQQSREGEQRDNEKGSMEEQGQCKAYRHAGGVHTAGRSGNDNSSRSLSYRKSGRPRSEISSRTDPLPSYSQRIRKLHGFGKSTSRQLSHETMVPSHRSQLLSGNLHNRRFSRRIQEGDRNLYHKPSAPAGSVKQLPQEERTYASSRCHTVAERANTDDSTRSVYPDFTAPLFGRPAPLPLPNMYDPTRSIFPVPGFGPGCARVPPGFYLPPQAASGVGAPPAFYLPLQTVPRSGIPAGLPCGLCPPPGFGAVNRFYSPPLATTGTCAPSGIYPLPQAPFGTGAPLEPLLRPPSVLGTDAPFGFNPPPRALFGPGAPPRFYQPFPPSLRTFPTLPTSQQDWSREKPDQTSATSQTTNPLPESLSSETRSSSSSASTSTATTAITPSLPTTSLPYQQKLVQPQWSESDYNEDGSSSYSQHCTTAATSATSIESFEFTPQFSPPIVRLFGGLFIHNCEEAHYVTNESMPTVI